MLILLIEDLDLVHMEDKEAHVETVGASRSPIPSQQ